MMALDTRNIHVDHGCIPWKVAGLRASLGTETCSNKKKKLFKDPRGFSKGLACRMPLALHKKCRLSLPVLAVTVARCLKLPKRLGAPNMRSDDVTVSTQ